MKTCFLLSCLTAATLFISSCQKDDLTETTPTPTILDYSHLTTGSNWTYKYTEGSAAPDTFKLTVLAKDTVANGRTYKVLSSSDGAKNNYMAKTGNNYYRFASFPAFGLVDVEELYLKDNEAVNATWNKAVSFIYLGNPYNANLVYVVKGKDQSRTVNGKPFSRVIHVKLDISVSLNGLSLPLGGGDFYYAEGIGMIESQIAVKPPVGDPYNSSQILIASEMK